MLDTFQEVKKAFIDLFSVDPYLITPHANFRSDLGLYAGSIVKLSESINRTGVEISLDDARKIKYVEDLVDYIDDPKGTSSNLNTSDRKFFYGSLIVVCSVALLLGGYYGFKNAAWCGAAIVGIIALFAALFIFATSGIDRDFNFD